MPAEIEPAPIVGGLGGGAFVGMTIVGRERALRVAERNADDSPHDELFHRNPARHLDHFQRSL